MSKYIIYALCEPDTNEIRYIGQSSIGLKRCYQHKKPSSLAAKSHKTNWINKLLAEGKMYQVMIIETLDSPEKLNEREMFWISHHKKIGTRLTNSTDGGEGNLGWVPSEETKEKISRKRKEFNEKNPEVAKAMGEACRKVHIFEEGESSAK